jgi:hypothetical protein
MKKTGHQRLDARILEEAKVEALRGVREKRDL